MGYRSDVVFLTYPNKREDYPLLKLYVDESIVARARVAIDDHDSWNYEVVDCDIGVSSNYSRQICLPDGSPFLGLQFKFNDIKWYDSYPDVQVLESAMNDWDENFIDGGEYKFHFEFVRVGEDCNDVEEKGTDTCGLVWIEPAQIHIGE